MDLTQRTAPTRPTTHNNIPQVTDTIQPVNIDRHCPCLRPLTTAHSKNQMVINKFIDELNSKTMHFYNLQFELDIFKIGST